jgi:putative ABC transport system permease protein
MLNLVSLLRLVIKRLWHNPGLTISALAGMVCVLALTISVPVFSNAVTREMLRRELAQQAEDTRRSLFSMHFYYNDTSPPYVLDVDTSRKLAEYIAARLEDLAGFKVKQVVTQIESPGLPMRAMQGGVYDDDNLPLKSLRFVSEETLPEHAQVILGQWPAVGGPITGPIEIAIHERMADGMGINVGEQYSLGQGIEVEVAAVWREIDPREEFWFNSPGFVYGDLAWIPQDNYQSLLEPRFANPVFSTSWYVIVDDSSLRLEQAPTYARAIQRLDNEMRSQLTDSRMDYSPYELLLTFQERADSLATLLYAVGAPMVALALLFIGLTSSIAVQQHTPEMATMRSRGTSRLQILTMNLGESVLLTALALPLSFAVGWYAATVMSQTLSFLAFTPRPALTLTYDGLSIPFLIGVIAFIVLGRLLPALRYSQRQAVRRQQQRSRESTQPLWQRLYLDVLLLLLALYAYSALRGWAAQTKLVPQVRLSGQPYRDPLLFVAPALFAIAASVVLLRVVPFLARVLEAFGARLPGVWQFLSLQQIARRPQDHTSALMLIMISLSLAVFAASAARTLDKWLLDSVYYDTGADLAVREEPVPETSEMGGAMFPNLASGSEEPAGGEESASVTLADLGMTSDWYFSKEQHEEIPGVENVTRVGRYKGTAFVGRERIPGWILGVDRMELPQVAFFRDDFATVPLGELMNRLGAKISGVLVPAYVAEEQGLNVGDYLLISIVGGEETYERDFEVVGVYDFFPTVYPDERATFIVNLEYIFGNPDAVDDYDIWLSLIDGTQIPSLTDEIAKEMQMQLSVKGDAFSEIKKGQELVERVGLFGVLNVGFFAAGLMAAIGFVLYSYAALRRRFIELGILQAIGLSLRQLVGYLVTEQLLLMGLAITGGVVVGLMTSYLFVPFLRTSASQGSPVPPFQVFIGWKEAAGLALGFGLVLCLTMLGTIAYLVRLQIFQAVKLGETL